jgi:hypothetical protein
MTLPSGAILLAFDDSERLRTPLALAMSRDGGEKWCGIFLKCLPPFRRAATMQQSHASHAQRSKD